MFRFSRLSPTSSRHASAFRAAAFFVSISLAAASMQVCADEIMIDDSPDVEDPAVTWPDEPAYADDGALIEDSGINSEIKDGISMEDIEEPQTDTELIEEIILPDADPEHIASHLEKMLETPNPTGTENELTVASYIGQEMKTLGYTVQQQPFHEGFLNEFGIDAPGVNVIAERGADSEENRTRDILLIVTHYDSKTSPLPDDPYANDKTGVAVLLETARLLTGVETDTDLCFLFLSGQEDGGYGAKAFLESLEGENRSRVKGVIAVDRIGYDTGMPNVLKTLTGEENSYSSLVQGYGLLQEAGLILDGFSPLPENMWADPDALQEEVQTQEYMQDEQDETEDAEDAAREMIPYIWSCLADPYTAPDDTDPAADLVRNSIQSIFADAQLPAVQITQYLPQEDLPLYRQTRELELADTTAAKLPSVLRKLQNDGISETMDTFNDVEIIGLEEIAPFVRETESAADDMPQTETEEEAPAAKADPLLLARSADVLAQTLAYIMGQEN